MGRRDRPGVMLLTRRPHGKTVRGKYNGVRTSSQKTAIQAGCNVVAVQSVH